MFFMRCFQKMREEENIQREAEKQQNSTTQIKIKRKEADSVKIRFFSLIK